MIKFDNSYAVSNEKILEFKDEVKEVHKSLHEGTCAGNDFIGWLKWPETYDKEEYARVKVAADKVKADGDVFLVCGIGGSYLGARSAIEMLNGFYRNQKPEIIFTGNGLSSTALANILDYIKGKSVYLNVISKSGTTTETAVAFRLFEQFMVETYGDAAKERIFATTDARKGSLKELADTKGYETFVVPDDIGGRFSVLTSVGLLPIAVSGVDIDEVMKGAFDAMKDLDDENLESNPAYQYAVARRVLNSEGKVSEMLVSYEPQMTMIAEWWKQLFGESEGKEGLGLLPTSCVFSTDLHSMGQFIQEGSKVLFETILSVKKPQRDLIFPSDKDNLDRMNYLAGKSVDWVNKMAQAGTLAAHHDTGNVPNLVIELDEITPYSYGYMTYFFFLSCAASVLLLHVNPFNQPGVEVYKKNMFKLLGKE